MNRFLYFEVAIMAFVMIFSVLVFIPQALATNCPNLSPPKPHSTAQYPLKVNNPIGINTVVTNDCTLIERTALIFFEIRDSEGVTQQISYRGIWVPYANSTAFGTAWTPDHAGTYQMRVFAIRSEANLEVLTGVLTSNVTVLGSENGNIVRTEFERKKFDIEYSMDSGYIYEVTADKDIATLSFQLKDVNASSTLMVKVPKRLLFEVFSCGIEPTPMNPDYEVVAFVDTIPVDTPSSFVLGDSKWQVMLEAGSREIQFVGTCVYY